jgi:CRP-like cAMP-binding protein
MARERRQRRANLSDLIAAKDYAQAIELLREQLSQRPPGVQRRLQLADLLLLAGRRNEALPILEAIAGELMNDGFAAKAVAILKRIDRLDPGRPDVEARLAQLAHRPGRPTQAPTTEVPPPQPAPASSDSDSVPVPAAPAEPATSVDPATPAEPAPPTAEAVPIAAPPSENNEDKGDHKEEETKAEAPAEPTPTPTDAPRRDDGAKAESDVAPSPEGFTGILKRLLTMLPRKSDDTASGAAAGTAAAEKSAAEKPETAAAESAAPPEASPEAPVERAPADNTSTEISTQPTTVEPPTENPNSEASTPAALPDAAPPAASPEPPPVTDEEPAANVVLDRASSEPASELTATSAEEKPAPLPVTPVDTPPPGPNVVEKLGGVFKKFLAALPGAGEDELDSEVAAREFVAALAASGLDQGDEDQGEFIAAFIDDDPTSLPEAEKPEEPAVAVDSSTAADTPSEPEPAAPSASSSATPAASAPRLGSGTPVTEADFRDQVLDLLEQVLKQPADAVESLVATTENTEPLAAAYRDTLLVHPLFSDLSPSEMLAVLRALRLVFMEPGDIIVTEGEPGASLFLIINGDVRLFVRNPAGHNVEVGRLTEGAFFGEMSLLSGKPRNATVTAGSRVEMLELPKAMLDGIAQAHPRVRDIVDALYLQRASSPEVAAVRSVPIGAEETRERASEVLRSYFGGRPFEPRMQLKLATVLLKSGKHEEAVPVLIALANELLREGDTPKAIAILKKVELIRKRSLEIVNLAPLARRAPTNPPSSAPEATPEANTETFFAQWLSDAVRRANAEAHTTPPKRVPGYAPDLLATPLFEGFTEEELLAFIQGLRLLAFQPGEVILTEGESGESVLILAAGTVKVSVRDPHGHSITLCELREGAFFGEISALSGRPRSATVTAAWNCELLELDRATLDGIATSHPRVRQVLEEAYIERAGSAEAARIRTAGRVQPEA